MATAMLRQENLLADILKVRSGGKPKPWWERTGVIPAATAVLTVLVTSITGYATQKALKDRENRFITTRETRQLARDLAKRANSSVGGMMKVNEERLRVARGEFDMLSDDQLREITRGGNRIQGNWRQEREDLESDLYLSFDSASGIYPAWKDARAAIEEQTACIERAYLNAQKTRIKAPICEAEIARSSSAVGELRSRLKLTYERLGRT